MLKALERSLLMGLGLLSLTREKAQTIAEELAKEGEVARDQVKEMAERLAERGEEERKALRKLVHDEVDSSLKEMRLATQSDVAALQAKVEELTRRLETLVAPPENPQH